MLRSYLLTALRNLTRQRGYTAINVTGLALGIACCVLLVLYVRSELSVNTHLPEADRIYRVGSEWAVPTMGLPITAPAPAGLTLVENYPEVEDQVRIWAGTLSIRTEGEPALRRSFFVADPNFLTFFDLPLLHGDARSALQGERPVVMSAAQARTLFGRTDVVGEQVLLETFNNGVQPYTVTAVWKDLPYNSLLVVNGSDPHELVVSAPPVNQDFLGEGGWTAWESRYLLVYARLHPGTDARALQAKLGDFTERFAPEAFHGNYQPKLESLRTLHLDDNDGQNRRAVWLLSALAALILLVACINFTNIATAQALQRAREVGVRKALGALRTQLLAQFLGEALVVSAGATLIGVALAQGVQQPFFEMVGKPLVLDQPWDATMALALLCIALVTGFLAGSYPGLVLSGFRPTRALKGTLRTDPVAARLRRGLVVAQFAVAVLLLAGGYIVQQQTTFLTSRSLGFDREHVVAIQSVPRDWTAAGVQKLEPVKRRLEQVPGVQSVSLSWETAIGGSSNTFPLRRLGQGPDAILNVARFIVDEDYDETYGLSLVEGQFVQEGGSQGQPGVVLNETAVQALGIEGAGSTLVVGDSTQVAVLGVVKDFHFTSFHEPLRPLVMASVDDSPLYRILSLRLAPGALNSTLKQIEQAWREVLPEAPFEYTFVEDDVAVLYASEQQLRAVVTLAAGLAVLIAALGMLGLVSISVVQRRKEIGVRKVLGANVLQVILLFARDFGVLVLAGAVVAGPVAFWLARTWLENFAYRIEPGVGPFVLAGALALGLALLVVAVQAARAASVNPAQVLRQE